MAIQRLIKYSSIPALSAMAILLSLSAPAPLDAQSSSVSGHVVDNTGSPIEHAAVDRGRRRFEPSDGSTS